MEKFRARKRSFPVLLKTLPLDLLKSVGYQEIPAGNGAKGSGSNRSGGFGKSGKNGSNADVNEDGQPGPDEVAEGSVQAALKGVHTFMRRFMQIYSCSFEDLSQMH